MYRYGDEKMDFSEAVLMAKVRLSPEDLDRYFAQDIALAIKTIINSLDDEIRKAKEGGYIKGCMDTEKEKNKIIEKLLEERKTMCTMEWKEVEPEQSDWEKQVNIIAYYGSVTIGSIVYCGDEIGWQSVIDGRMDFMQAKSLEDAKREMIDILDNHCTDQINYYEELRESIEELN